jgi:hypothetical protein
MEGSIHGLAEVLSLCLAEGVVKNTKTSVKLDFILAEILTEHLPNTRLTSVPAC